MKSNRKYWEKRTLQGFLDVLEHGELLHKRLGEHFAEAQSNIEKEVAHLYSKHARDNAISPERAMEPIKGQEYRRWRMGMEDYLQSLAVHNDKALMLELNTLCMRPRINRLEALEGEILAQMAVLADVEDKDIGQHLKNVLEDTYYRTMYEHYRYKNPALLKLMQKHDVALSKANIEAVLTYPWSGRNYSQNIWGREHQISRTIRSTVSRNILEGKSIENLTAEMAKTFGDDYENQARRLIHTETAFFKGQGDLMTYDKLGVDKYEYLATLDGKTSKACQDLDGQVFRVKDATPGKNYPPMHPHCRSTTVAYFEDRERDGMRVARGADRETYKVPEGLKYHEWRAKYGSPKARAGG